MKSFFLLLLSISLVYMAQAQAKDSTSKDSTLKEYTGNYKFPEGSYLTAIEVSIKDGKLYASSDKGASPLEQKAKDTFAFTNYNGMAYFFRNSDGKVARMKIDVEDILLEGNKEGVTAWIKQNNHLVKRKQLQVK